MDLPSEKKRLREAITQRLSRLRPHDRDSESRTICKRIIEQLPKTPITAAVYYPMKSEADITYLMEELLKRQSTLFLSRAEGKGFEFRQVTSLKDLVMGPFRILEPKADTPLLNKADLQYVFVPGLSFDRSGNRLGRGSGGYDKWLSGLRKVNPTVQVWGIALEWQMTHAVPVESHDQKMDRVITAREMFTSL